MPEVMKEVAEKPVEGGIVKSAKSIIVGIAIGATLGIGGGQLMPADEAETVGRAAVDRMAVVSEVSKIVPDVKAERSGLVADTVIDSIRTLVACRVTRDVAEYVTTKYDTTITGEDTAITPRDSVRVVSTVKQQPRLHYSPVDEFAVGDLIEVTIRKNHQDIGTVAYPYEAGDESMVGRLIIDGIIYEDQPAVK